MRQKVHKTYRAAEQASERYNEISAQMKDARSQVKALRTDVERQQKAFDQVRDRLGSTIANQLTTSPMGPTAQLLSSDNPDAFLDGLSALEAYNSNQSDLLSSYEDTAEELKVRKDQLTSKLAVIKDSKQDLAKEKAVLDKKSAEAKSLLAKLTREQRSAVNQSEGGGSSADVGPVNASGRSKKAIDFALAQIGEPYVYGAAGPGSWDCSGLTMAAWGAAGVSLPHSSSGQAGMGSPVSRSSMSPGDLVFYYSPVSHVGIYLGNGKLVHAPHPGSSVEVVPVDSMPITTVRRVG
ncbi:MAG: NlpC/P60 family protein [Nocardioidaceae bacterium]